MLVTNSRSYNLLTKKTINSQRLLVTFQYSIVTGRAQVRFKCPTIRELIENICKRRTCTWPRSFYIHRLTLIFLTVRQVANRERDQMEA